MIYLKNFSLIDDVREGLILSGVKNINNSYYPFRIFPMKEFKNIEFEPITIFYGGNGSGKTTLLNIIATKINATKKNVTNYGDLFDTFVNCCDYELNNKILKEIKLILSDDVFDYLIDTKAINSRVNRLKDDLSDEYLHYKFTSAQNLNNTLDQYEELKNKVDANRLTQSKYIRARLRNNTIPQESNGETALSYWQNEIKDNAIYIIDEPENSLSAENQLKLKQFIEESVRFYNCQFIIATHSPFLLNLCEAKIYDLDSIPVISKKWNELENVKTYYKFFKDKEKDFE